MNIKSKLSIVGIIVVICFLGGPTQGSIQVYDTDLGKIKLDLPMTLTPTAQSSGDWLDLAKPGSIKPIIAIRIQEPYGEDLEKYASSMGFKENRIQTETNDGHTLLFFTESTGTEEQYVAFIDYLNEKNKILQIWTHSEVHAKGETLARFNSDDLMRIAKSFAFVNASELQALNAEKSNESEGFDAILAIVGILGIIYAIKRTK